MFCKYHICNNLALGQIPEKLNFDSMCVYFANITFATNPQLLCTMFKPIKRQHLCNTLATGGFAHLLSSNGCKDICKDIYLPICKDGKDERF